MRKKKYEKSQKYKQNYKKKSLNYKEKSQNYKKKDLLEIMLDVISIKQTFYMAEMS